MDEENKKKEDDKEEFNDKEDNDRKSGKKDKESLTDRLRKNPWILSTIVLVVLVIVLLFFGSSPNPGTGFSINETKEVSDLIDDDFVLGNLSAPVTIIEFSDYECTFCRAFHETSFNEIKRDYIDTGKVNFVFKDFPLEIHPNSMKAAESAECAGEQGKYWEMHNKLFQNGNKLKIIDLKLYAKELELNTSQFNLCLDSSLMSVEVQKDFEEGLDLGVSGTPIFFINGKKILGAQPFRVFKTVIDEELKKM